METENDAPNAPAFSFVGLTEFLGRPDAGGSAAVAPGSRVGDVTIVRLVGEGGMGRVYEGLQGMPRRTVAVKVMRSGMLSAAAARRFEHEAQILGRLNHPSIARIYSVGMERGPDGVLPYFVMEYLDDARPITAYAAERNLSARERVGLFREACQAVAHGHGKGVIHRDLKPGNILVDAAGHPKVIDFGVARSTDSDVALTTLHTDVGQLVGTLQYMSPEQFAGSSDDLDVRADVYALGVVLYELLAGRPPYDVAKLPIYDVARIVRETEPASLATVNARLRGDLNTIVATCLEKDRGRRYASAAELEADLGRYLRGEPIAASPPGLVDSLVRLARRHRAAALAAAGVLAALMAGLVGISLFAMRAERERATAIRERERADAAGREAVDQLYIANLRALRACIDNANLRLARTIVGRNLAILDGSPTLEMRLLAAGLDDALVVLDMEGREVDDVAYSPAGDVLGAAVFETGETDESRDLYRHFSNAGMRAIDLLFFSIDGRLRHAPLATCADGWVAAWQSNRRDSGTVVDESRVTLAASPDGRLAAVHHGDGRIHVVGRSHTGSDVVLAEYRGRVARAAFNADGNRVAVQSPAGHVMLWDTGSGDVIARPNGEDGDVSYFRFSPDGARLATVATRNRLSADEIRFLDAADGRRLATVTPPRTGIYRDVPVFAFSPDGRRVVTSSPAHELDMWDVSTGERLGSLPGHTAAIGAVAFSPDGTQLASGAVNGQLRLCDPVRMSWEQTLSGHDASISAIAFRPGGETFASGSQDGTVRVWSRTLREPLAVLPGLRGTTAVAFSPDGACLAVAPRGTGGVELWDARSVERLHRFPGPGGDVSQVAFSPDGALLAAASGHSAKTGEVRVWCVETGQLVATLGGFLRGTVSMSFSPDGSRLLTTCGDERVTVWDPRNGRRCMAASAGRDLRGAGTRAVFGLDGSRIAYSDNTLLDAATGEAVVRLFPQGLVTCLAASPDGRTLATGVAFGSVCFTDFATGTRLPLPRGHTAAVKAIAFSSDGSRLATGSVDGTARLWDVSTGAEIRAFVGHEGGVETVIFNPDGLRLVTGASDGTTRIWDVERGHELLALPNQAGCPTAIALSPDGTCLVTAASDGSVRIWGLSNADVVRARQAVTDRP